MQIDLVLVLEFGALIVLQVWAGVSLLRFAWRSWHGPVAVEPFFMRWQTRLARTVFGEARYQEQVARLQAPAARRRFAAITAIVAVVLLFLAGLYVGMLASGVMGTGVGAP